MNSESEVSDDFRKKLHCTLAFIGGYIGAYALLNRADVFGNAQTSNLIHVAMSIVGTDFLDLFIRLGGVILYMAGGIDILLTVQLLQTVQNRALFY